MNLDNVVANVTNFIKYRGKVVVCGVCLEVTGFEPIEILDGAIIGTDEIILNYLLILRLLPVDKY